MNRVGIFGASGMAREAGDIAWALGLEPVYVARDESERDTWGYPGAIILESEVERYLQQDPELRFVIGIGENVIRRRVAERFADRVRFTNLVHPSATFGRDQKSRLDQCQGVIVAAGARFTSGITVGDFSIFNQNVTVAHDCIIDEYVHVAPGANISGNVHLKAGCWVGAGAVINQGGNHRKLTVHEGALVGSGAVVIRDCEPGAVYAGVPAKRIK